MSAPLDGIVVFDMTLAGVGPYATMELGGMGADVIKFEEPSRAAMESQLLAPRQNGLGCAYAHCHLNKRIVHLDFKKEENRVRARVVLERADVFVQNMRPGTVTRLGFGYDDVRAINPTIVYVDSSGWGSRGPMRQDSAADPPLQAFSAFTSLNGQPGGPGEFYRAYGFLDMTASQTVVLAVLDGLLLRQRTGKGQYLSTTMLGASLLLQRTRIAEYLATGDAPVRRGSAAQFIVPDQAFLCLDNAYVAVSVTTDEQWRRLVTALEAESLAAELRLTTNAGRVVYREEVVAALEPIFLSRPVRWWEVLLSRHRIPVARMHDYTAVVNHPQVRAGHMIVTLDTKQAGPMDFAAYPWRFDGEALTVTAPPRPGEHTDEVLSEYPIQRGSRPPDSLGTETVRRAIEGLRVVDLTAGVCGPLAGAVLAEMGAQITKVETPEGDPAETWGPAGRPGPAPAYADLNRAKTIVKLDLNGSRGRSALAELISEADVLLDDGEASLLAQAGIDRSGLVDQHPGLVHCTITGFGEEGPLAGAPASELVVQAMATTFLGFGRLGDPPVRMGADAASATAAVHAVQGALAALWRRHRTGAGGRISINMLHSMLHIRGILWTGNKNPDEWMGYAVDYPTQPPSSGYRTRDVPVTFNLGRMTDDEFEKMMIDFGMGDCLDDPRFADHANQALGARVYAHEVRHLWERTTTTMASDEVLDFVYSHGGEGQRLNDYSTLFVHPQIEAIEAVKSLPGGGRALTLPWDTDGPEGFH